MSNLPPAKELDINGTVATTAVAKRKLTSGLEPKRAKEIEKTMQWYDSKQELQTFKNPDYAKEALAIAPMWLYKQALPEAIKNFRYKTTYDFTNKTIVIKIHDYDGKLTSYKRRRLNGGKWITFVPQVDII